VRRAAPIAAVILAGLAAAAWLLRPDIGGGSAGVDTPPAGGADPSAVAERFLDTYMDADGRVVRRDQGGDTVSEGQSYAMLLAAAIGDRGRFEGAWRWARDNLGREDGLLASRWADGGVADSSPASDADLDAAHALLVAAGRFDAPEYRRDAERIGAAVLERETVPTDHGLALVAGPWARESAAVNPSYFAPRAYLALANASADQRWEELARSGRAQITALTEAAPSLPPDWARVEGDRVTAIGAPGDAGAPPRYGYDAVRAPIRLADSCAPADRALASRAWAFLRAPAAADELAAEYELDGDPAAEGSHPSAIVAAAAAAEAAGDGRAAGELLGRAAAAERESPSYYGAAWVALGHVMLETEWLGEC
jgi:endo-1,4-beta-D-glucanase Y